MKLKLSNSTHPEVTVLSIDLEHKRVVFRNRDGVCSSELIGNFTTIVPTKNELLEAINAVLFEADVNC